MGFWEDSSPVVKIALVLGVLGIIYFAVAFFVGLTPFPPKCSHEVDGASVSGCPENAECVDGECVVQQRGIPR
jgi:hypothetical protein